MNPNLGAILLSDRLFQALFREVHGDLLHTPEAVRSCVHGLHGGAVEKAYVDFDLLVEDPTQASEVAGLFARFIVGLREYEDPTLLAFLKKNDEESRNTVGALLLAAKIASSDGVQLPYKVVRLDSEIQHQRMKFERGVGPLERALSGERVVLISDHSSRGTEVIDALDTLAEYDAKVIAVAVLTRIKHLFEESKAQQVFAERGVEFVYFFDVLPPPDDQPDALPRVVPNPSIPNAAELAIAR